MLTGRHIREARDLLGLKRSIFAHKVGRMTTLAIMRSEEHDDGTTLSPEQDEAVQRMLERLGVDAGPTGMRLRAKDSVASEVGAGLGHLPAASGELNMSVQVGDHVRFLLGKAPDALKGRETAAGVVTELIPYGGPELWPMVEFDCYRTGVLQPGQLEVVGTKPPVRDDPEMAS